MGAPAEVKPELKPEVKPEPAPEVTPAPSEEATEPSYSYSEAIGGCRTCPTCDKSAETGLVTSSQTNGACIAACSARSDCVAYEMKKGSGNQYCELWTKAPV